MRVLICHELYEPDFAGGGEVLVRQTALGLRELGVSVKVLTTGDPAIDVVDGIPTLRLPIHRYRFNMASRQASALAREADVIQTFTYHACLPALGAGRRTGRPVVCGVLGLFADEWTRMRGRLVGAAFQRWERFLLRRPYGRIFFFSESSRSLGLGLGVDPRRSFVLAPGVDSVAFRPAPQKDDAVLFASKLDARKGVEDLVVVARALPDVRFRVIGWGSHPAAESLRSLDNVEMLPFSRGAALHDAFARARVFFFPSRADPFGLVLAEAMAAGCAIVSTVDVGFAGEVVPRRDVAAMVTALRGLWDDRERSLRLGRDNVERARLLTWRRYAETLRATYGELLASGPSAPGAS